MTLNFQIDSPLLEIEEYCRRTGAEVSAVKRQLDDGHMPFVKLNNVRGGKRLINMVELFRIANDAENFS